MSDDREAYVYALIDSDGQARYIGETTDPDKRRLWHWYNRRYDSGNMPLKEWLRSLDGPPGIVILDTVPYEDRYKSEAAWTVLFRWVYGETLLNMNDGNEPSEETRARMSAAKTPEVRARLSEFMKGEWARRRSLPLIDAGPADEARALGVEMTMMAVRAEFIPGVPMRSCLGINREMLYVRVYGALRAHAAPYLATGSRTVGEAAVQEHVKDVIFSLPDDDIWELDYIARHSEPLALAETFMDRMNELGAIRREIDALAGELDDVA
ncbi:GIY-YIG nuclease family protein [Streptomyces sp. NPDC060011]|uniref:GIY-YIG nuclease family protein n=1 Tax=Streptomyces sp. NPDC060011 TaxID=3347037 RepID=UPI0036B1A71E